MGKINLNGKTALITGAASGIGRATAISLSKRGCHLALADINQEGLAETVRLLESGVTVSTHFLDVSDQEAIAHFPQEIQAAHPALDILINNAGVALYGTFEEVGTEEFAWLFNINFLGRGLDVSCVLTDAQRT